MTGNQVKKVFYDLGAEFCGIASIDRFDKAPKGFHPTNVMPSCKSVISYGCRIPISALMTDNKHVYTFIRDKLTQKLNDIALEASLKLEQMGMIVLPLECNDSVYDADTDRYRSLISAKHAAQAAGVGSIGRNTLLITPEFGSMVWLGSVLTNAELEPDPLIDSICARCNICVEACPVNALESEVIKQWTCHGNAFDDNDEIICHKCRDVCPYCFGTKNKILCDEISRGK